MTLSTGYISICWMGFFLTLIHWVAIYPFDSIICPFKHWTQPLEDMSKWLLYMVKYWWKNVLKINEILLVLWVAISLDLYTFSIFYKELCPNLLRGRGEFMKLLHSALQDLGLTYSPPQYVLLLNWAILHSQCLSTKGHKWDISICLGVWGNLQWTNVQSRGNRNTFRSFVGIESNWNASVGRLVGLWHLYSFVVLFQYKIFFKVTEQ